MVQLTPFAQTKPLINNHFKGVTPPGRHTRPACNQVLFFYLLVNHWTINHRLVRANGRLFLIQFASWI